MLNYDGGYIGRSRSVRSQQAIDSFEMPISLSSDLDIFFKGF